MRSRHRTLLAGLFVALFVAGCSPANVLNAFGESDARRLVADVAYGSDPRQRLDIYVPNKEPGPYPVVLFFYGGSWNSGARADFRFVGDALAARGVLTIIADYRLYPQVRYPEFLEDNAQAAAWTIANVEAQGGDPTRIYLMGHSSGAYNAAMLALDPRWLAKVGVSTNAFAGFIGLAGPYDFLPIGNRDVQPVFFYPNSPPDSQPILYAGRGSPRSFLAVPANDDLVDPERNTHQLAQKLAANGVPVTYKSYPRVSHVTLIGAMSRPLRWLAPVLDDVDTFIRSDGKSVTAHF
jgi:acetyl esterase/lipase